ncbi:MAG: SPFH domain-containing protein [Jatrophihabitantaceae bacterium]
MTAIQQVPSPPTSPVGHEGVRIEIAERPAPATTGWLGVLALLACIAGAILVAHTTKPGWAAAPVVLFAVVLQSLTVVAPGQTRVVQFFGRYVGTVRRPGFWWMLPFTVRIRVSVRVRNFETNHLKVNDADGNPVEIAAIVVWQVTDTARATYAVDSYLDFVSVQAESALRHVATTHPYDGSDEDLSLRGSTDLVAEELAVEVAQRVVLAGVEIIEVRISHLAYAAEIAQAMLRRQQANAVVAARSRIVEGAVGMVEMALTRLSERQVVDLDEERKAAMVSNLMVVLCGDQPAAPIVNTGSLYT